MWLWWVPWHAGLQGSFHHKDIDDLLEGNKQWVAKVNEKDPGFFKRLAKGQSPSREWCLQAAVM